MAIYVWSSEVERAISAHTFSPTVVGRKNLRNFHEHWNERDEKIVWFLIISIEFIWSRNGFIDDLHDI